MPTKRGIFAVAALLAWLAGTERAAAATTVQRPGVPFTVDVWDPEADDGLPQKSVTAIAQARDGYLWLGTLNGLVRFDGTRFTPFDESNTPGLESSRIVSLFEDEQGNLWIGTETGGIALLKEGQVTSTGIGRGSREARLASACQDASGAVWLYTMDGQLWRLQNGRPPRAFVVDLGRPSTCRTIIAERGGPVWVGTETSVSAIASALDPSSLELPVEQTLPVGRLDLLLASRNGGYWRLADYAIQKWTTNHLDRNWGPYPWGRVPVSAACEDREGNLVVGTRGAGVFWFDAEGKAACLSTNEGLTYNFVLSLLVDDEGSLWVGTDGGGLNRVKRQVFEVLEPTRGWVVQSVCEDAHGGLWIGANGGEVGCWKDGSLRRFGLARGLPNLPVKAVFADRNQQVWLGTHVLWGSGLFRWEEDRFQPVTATNTIPSVVQAIHEDRSNRLWLGTQQGLVRRNEDGWRVFTTRDGLSSDVVSAITDDAEGNLWVGTVGGGLNLLRDGRFAAFRKGDKDGPPSDDISSLWLDAEGVLWIGTSGGLARFREGRWTRYTTRDGLISNSIGYLIEDDQGCLWIGSNLGLMRIEKRALHAFAAGTSTSLPVRAYKRPDGLPTRECTQGSQPGACRTRDGRLWFPTINGLVSVNPAQLNRNTNPPPVMIESVLIDGQAQQTNSLRPAWPQPLTIPPGRERVDFHFTSLNLAAPDRARFRYRLEGHERAWIDAGGVRVAHYSKLPPGDYVFQVIACNEDGVWTRTPASLAITVQIAFWKTWWFRTAAATGLVGMCIALVFYLSTQRLQRQVERMRQQEALEKERARIARDLHDQLGANLTQVSLLGEMVEGDKDLPHEVESHARQISQTARETTRALDEIVWAANPANDTLEGLINYACKYAQEYLALAGVRYRLEVPPQVPNMTTPPDLRHNVFLAFKEAVNNVVKHAQAKAVWVRLKLEPGRFTLEVEDDGRGPAGLDEKAAQSRNGLRNMRKRMDDVGGSFSIGPRPEGGTVVRLTAPLRGP